MTDAPAELTQQAIATANRLRQIQADFADETAQAREGYLSDELQRILSTIVPDQRQVFMEALREHFPTWEANMATPQSQPAQQESSSPSDLREWNDVSFVVERLIELAAPLPSDQKRRLADQLRGAGLAAAGGGGDLPPELVTELKGILNLDPQHEIDPTRLLEMACRLVHFAHSLDQLAWKIWKTIAPKSPLRGSGLQGTMARFAKGDGEAPLSRDLEQLRHLVASLLSSISQVGRQFGQQHLAKFAPNEIEASAAMEPGGFLVAKEIKCWRKYQELAKSFDDPAAIDNQVMQIITEFVSSMPGLRQ
jgi:hypothetical protein